MRIAPSCLLSVWEEDRRMGGAPGAPRCLRRLRSRHPGYRQLRLCHLREPVQQAELLHPRGERRFRGREERVVSIYSSSYDYSNYFDGTAESKRRHLRRRNQAEEEKDGGPCNCQQQEPTFLHALRRCRLPWKGSVAQGERLKQGNGETHVMHLSQKNITRKQL